MSKRQHSFAAEAAVIIFALVFVSPFYFIVVNSFKPLGEILSDPSALPRVLSVENYVRGSATIRFPRLFVNSLIVTGFSLLLILFFGAIASWKMARFPRRRLYRTMYVFYILAMIVPFQTVMIPVVQVSSWLHILNTRHGLIFLYIGFGLPLTIFLYHGFIASVPLALEESARIDGANDRQVFFRIVIPLINPITITIAILHILWIWNDFLLPSLILYRNTLLTIPIGINMFFGQYDQQWDKALSVLVLSILPIIVIFLFLQKYFIAGVTSGAVKG
jgi:raffinose/stachyose/melibiose transport system permease protein